MTGRMQGSNASASDYIQNTKLLATKFIYNQNLYDAFFKLFDAALNNECGAKCFKWGHDKRHCSALKFIDLADGLEIFSIINYRTSDQQMFEGFLARLAARM